MKCWELRSPISLPQKKCKEVARTTIEHRKKELANCLTPFSLSTRSQIPHDLRSITSIDAASEVAPKKVGMTRAGLRAIWSAVEDFYRSGIHPAIQVCLRRKGEIVLNRAIGHASGNGPEDSADTRKIPATTETPFNIFFRIKSDHRDGDASPRSGGDRAHRRPGLRVHSGICSTR